MNITDLHPLNAVGLMLNGTMLLTLVICISLGRRKLKTRRKSRHAVTLLQAGDQCWLFSQVLDYAAKTGLPASTAGNGYHLKSLTKEDRL